MRSRRTLLAVAASVLAGSAPGGPHLTRLASRAIVAALAVRGGAGLAGRGDLISPGSASPRFRSLDRRVYSPVCLTLATLALPAAAAGSEDSRPMR